MEDFRTHHCNAYGIMLPAFIYSSLWEIIYVYSLDSRCVSYSVTKHMCLCTHHHIHMHRTLRKHSKRNNGMRSNSVSNKIVYILMIVRLSSANAWVWVYKWVNVILHTIVDYVCGYCLPYNANTLRQYLTMDRWKVATADDRTDISSWNDDDDSISFVFFSVFSFSRLR